MRTGAIAIGLMLFAPGAALACAVCGFDAAANRAAFLGSTIGLSLLPLAVIATGLWLLKRRLGATWREEFVDRDEGPLAEPRARRARLTRAPHEHPAGGFRTPSAR